MKVAPTNTIKISGKSRSLQFLKNIPKGSEIYARIIERPGNKKAILEINGNRINAEFIKGVPGRNLLTIKLENNENDLFIFKLVDAHNKDEFINKLLDFTIFNSTDIKNNLIYYINNYLNNNNTIGIYELNLFLLNLTSKSKKNKSLTLLLNRLLGKGINSNTLINIAYILSGTQINPQLLFQCLLFLRKESKHSDDFIFKNSSRLIKKVDDLITSLNDLQDDNLKKEIIDQLINLLSINHEKDIINSEISYYENDKFKAIRVIGQKNSIIISLELSEIGIVDILFRITDDELNISFFVNNDVFDFINKTKKELYSKLNKIIPKININIYNRSDILNKLIEINSYYIINSELDIKV